MEIIDMISMWNPLVPTVNVITSTLHRHTGSRILLTYGEDMLIVMLVMREVQMPVVHIIDMSFMFDRSMPTIGTVRMDVLYMQVMLYHGAFSFQGNATRANKKRSASTECSMLRTTGEIASASLESIAVGTIGSSATRCTAIQESVDRSGLDGWCERPAWHSVKTAVGIRSVIHPACGTCVTFRPQTCDICVTFRPYTSVLEVSAVSVGMGLCEPRHAGPSPLGTEITKHDQPEHRSGVTSFPRP